MFKTCTHVYIVLNTETARDKENILVDDGHWMGKGIIIERFKFEIEHWVSHKFTIGQKN